MRLGEGGATRLMCVVVLLGVEPASRPLHRQKDSSSCRGSASVLLVSTEQRQRLVTLLRSQETRFSETTFVCLLTETENARFPGV